MKQLKNGGRLLVEWKCLFCASISMNSNNHLVHYYNVFRSFAELIKIINGTDHIPVSDEDTYINPNENDTDSGSVVDFKTNPSIHIFQIKSTFSFISS